MNLQAWTHSHLFGRARRSITGIGLAIALTLAAIGTMLFSKTEMGGQHHLTKSSKSSEISAARERQINSHN